MEAFKENLIFSFSYLRKNLIGWKVKMSLKYQLIKASIEEYQRKIINIENHIKNLNKTKEMWELRLRSKLKEIK